MKPAGQGEPAALATPLGYAAPLGYAQTNEMISSAVGVNDSEDCGGQEPDASSGAD